MMVTNSSFIDAQFSNFFPLILGLVLWQILLLPKDLSFVHTVCTNWERTSITVINFSSLIHRFFVFTPVAFELILCIQLITTQMTQTVHFSQDMVVWTDFTRRTKRVTSGYFRANQVPELPAEFESTTFTNGPVRTGVWSKS